MSAARIPMIGIVGGIGSGKSTLATALQSEFRTCRLDADTVGHQVLRQPEVRATLTEKFGQEILGQDGEISRPSLARLVFGESAEKQAARAFLEQTVHPVIRKELHDQIQRHRIDRDCDLIVLDAALLLESGWSQHCDAIVFLDVPQAVRLARVQKRGWDAAELERREQSQLSLNEKRQHSDVVIDQSVSIEESAKQLAKWIRTRFPELNVNQPQPA